MLKNYFTVAWRNLVKQKQFTFLNLMGLSTGLACVLLILLWVQDEWKVDKFNANDQRLYQVIKKADDGAGNVHVQKHTQGQLAQAMATDLPEVEYAVQVRKDENHSILSFADKHIRVTHQFAGKDFFKIFSYPLVNGDTKDVAGVSGIFLSDKLAMKLFNTTNVAGVTVDWKYKDDPADFTGVYTIAGVFQSPPASATDQFDVLVPFDLYAQKFAGTMGDVTFWGSNMVSTYVLLKKNTDGVAFSNKIKDYAAAKVKSLYPANDLYKYEGQLFASRFSDGYLYNNYINGVQSGGRIEYVQLFSLIAIFILVIACINFMNLSTAKAAGRMKETGIRKVIGAPRRALILQYMAESILLSFVAVLIALVIASLLLPAFRQITGKELSITFSPSLLFALVGIAIVTGVLAGSYPALYLSAFKPVMVLKGKLNTSASAATVRKGLVVFQFTVSLVLIVAVMVVYRQMQFVQSKNLGYNKDHIIRFAVDGNLQDNPAAFYTTIKSIPGVTGVAGMNGNLLGHAGHSGGGISWEGKDPNLHIEYYGVSGDENYPGLLGMKLAEGRSFSAAYGADSNAVIFNEAAIAAMQLKNPIGKIVSLWGKKKQVIGVVKDFHFESLYKKVGPAFLEYSPQNETVLVKLSAGKEKEAIASVAKAYKNFNQGIALDYTFLDEDYSAMYAAEQRVAALSKYFAVIAIIVSCLGLFGLAAFTAQKRQKEIGVRKVIGASASNIVVMLSGEFLKLVLIAICIAFPLGWWMMQHWLQGFAYRTTISSSIFLVTAIGVVLITLFTVGYQAIKAGLANPVKSLRTE
ncbi:MAG: ABC transporter permease [Chitinophagaceae bacterium]